MKRVITEQHYLNKYKGHNSHLTRVDRFKKDVQEFAPVRVHRIPSVGTVLLLASAVPRPGFLQEGFF